MLHSPTTESPELDCGCLYIYTIPLVSNAFPWALVHVDQDGAVTSYQWAPTTLDQTARGPKAYVEQTLPHSGPMSKVGKDNILAYFKISDFSPMNITQPREVCASTFPTSYSTAQEKRRAGITCRTWVTHILGRLITDERAQDVEDLVKKHSYTACSGTFATDFLLQKRYQTHIHTS